MLGDLRFHFSDEFNIAAEHLREVQQRRIDDYVENMKENEDDDRTKSLSEAYVDLRIHDEKDNYKRCETRTHHNLIQLKEDVQKCHPISIAELFLPDREDGSPPKRILVFGKAEIGQFRTFINILYRLKHVLTIEKS